MTAQPKSVIKSYFQTGDKPTQAQFEDLVDSYVDTGSGGAITGPSSAFDSQIALFDGTSGTVIKAATTTGLLKATSGVITNAVSGTDYAPPTSGSGFLKGDGGGGFTTQSTIALSDLSTQAADTFLANATSGAAVPTAVALSASQLAGKGASGNIAAISLGTGLSMSGTTLSATNATAPALVYLNTFTATNSATVDLISVITSTYNDYLIVIDDVVPQTTNTNLFLRTSADNGSSFDTGANYDSNGTNLLASAAALTFNPSEGGTSIQASTTGVNNSTSLGGLSGTIRLYNPNGTALHKRIDGVLNYRDGGAGTHNCRADFFGVHKATAAYNAVRFFMSSGNIVSGTFKVYGITKS